MVSADVLKQDSSGSIFIDSEPVASTRVQGWGDEAPKGVGCGVGVWGGGSAPCPENFLFCDLEMAYFGEF